MAMKSPVVGMSGDEGGCRFGWHPKVLAFFVTAALGFSIMSSLDCKFLAVDLGFVPQNYYSEKLGFGLWTYAAPGGRCLSYGESIEPRGVFEGVNLYTNILINDDITWSVSRVLAVAGVTFGAVALLSTVVNVCKSEPHLVDILAYSTITAFMSESSKLGLFLGTDLCKSSDYWYNTETHLLSASKYCEIDRGAFMSISSIGAYFVSMILAVGFATRPKIDDFTYEEASLPSWMASESGSTANANAPPQPRELREKNSSVGGYDWSRSGPSTIPSEDHNVTIPKQSQNREHSQAYPPINRPPRIYDDCSTLTWDPGY